MLAREASRAELSVLINGAQDGHRPLLYARGRLAPRLHPSRLGCILLRPEAIRARARHSQ